MTPEQHIFACALVIERQHGERARVHVASEIGRLALDGDFEGVAMWKRIAAVLDGLQRSGSEFQ